MTRRMLAVAGVAGLASGCVQPAYQMPGPIQLQPYPPPVSYQYAPDGRPPLSGPIPLQAAPPIQPLPPALPTPTVDSTRDVPTDAIPLQEMPAPAIVDVSPTPDAPTPVAAAPEVIRKAPAAGVGSNVPLEGFRPMHGQTRPAP